MIPLPVLLPSKQAPRTWPQYCWQVAARTTPEPSRQGVPMGMTERSLMDFRRMDTFTESHQVHAWDVLSPQVSLSSNCTFCQNNTNAGTREDPPKHSGSWDIAEMPHQKGKGVLPGGTAHLRHGQKHCPAKTLPPAQMSA